MSRAILSISISALVVVSCVLTNPVDAAPPSNPLKKVLEAAMKDSHSVRLIAVTNTADTPLSGCVTAVDDEIVTLRHKEVGKTTVFLLQHLIGVTVEDKVDCKDP